MSTNTIISPLKQTYSINDINETANLTNFTPSHLLLNSFFTNQKQSKRCHSFYVDDDNLNTNHSTDSHFLASSIGIFGLCRAFLVFVLLPPKNESNE
ncbi:hypothetical protein GLOIN_2v1497116 [Rhizophagus clarus]|uniref:Uncharacterized protein n=1 Tax=Rhizophagus clarus TaxID=94130 RepID=A0A8H3KTN5_9GLOM|nr:hypothetical protein GLOIN_2v1497116 [Rhizophagus clarus]